MIALNRSKGVTQLSDMPFIILLLSSVSNSLSATITITGAAAATTTTLRISWEMVLECRDKQLATSDLRLATREA